MKNVAILGKFWPESKNNFWIFCETVGFTLAILAICYFLNPKNPLFFRSIFPWPWIAPVIIVLRYGFGFGFISVILVGAATITKGASGTLLPLEGQNYILSGMGLTFICGLFSSSLIRRCDNAETLMNYSNERLNSLAKSYYLLHISHSNLVQSLITQPITLRSVMEKLRKILLIQNGEFNSDLAYQFLQLVSQTCSIHSAGIYVIHKTSAAPALLSEIGNMGDLMTSDPVLKEALKTDKMAYVSSESINTNYLIVAPLVQDKYDQRILLVVKDMSFKSLTQETLKVLHILINYFMEDAQSAPHIHTILQTYPDCPENFARELLKLITLKEKLNIDSALTAVILSKNLRPHNAVYNITQRQRTLDSVWIRNSESFDYIFTLMPLTDAAGIQGFFQRIERILTNELGINIIHGQVEMRSMQITVTSPVPLLESFLKLTEDTVSC